MANFGSDNAAGVHPKILESLARASAGNASAYGEDALSKSVDKRFSELFECDCTVLLVSTGTAANSIALAALCPPYGAVFSHNEAHIANDESTAPELFTGGARQLSVGGEDAKPSIEKLRALIQTASSRGVHSILPSVLALSNLTELGARMSPDELKAYREVADEFDLKLMVDGARFSNVVGGCADSPADLTWRSGVDVLCFGATKNGAMAAEAIVFFNQAVAVNAERIRKRGGHLWSKHRFLAAQFDAFLADDLWLANARHANEMGQSLKSLLQAIPGIEFASASEANELFVRMPKAVAEALWARGHAFYEWPSLDNTYRLVTSFTTEQADVDAFCADLKGVATDC